MPGRSRTIRPIPALVASLAAGLAGCGAPSDLASLGTPSTVGTQVSVVHHLTIPAGFTAKSLTISPAGANVPVGQALRYQISLVISDGKNSANDRSLTDPGYVDWSVSDPTAGIIDDSGLFTPRTPRITAIQASVGNVQASVPVTIGSAIYAWQQVPTPTANDLFGVKAVSDQEAWAVGSGGTVLHWINNFWQPFGTFVVPGSTLKGVDFADGVGWIVGFTGDSNNPGSPLIYRYQFGQWVATPCDGSGGLNAVATVGANDAWAVGRTGTGNVLIEHWNGSSWTHDPSVDGVHGQLNAITMLGGGQGWAVGHDGDDPLILAYDGTGWHRQNLKPFATAFHGVDLRGVAMVSGTHGWAVGQKTDAVTGWTHGLVLEYDNRGGYQLPIFQSTWKEVDAASGQTPYLDQVPLNGIGLLQGGQGWILGATVTPRIWHPVAALNDLYGNLLSFDGTNYHQQDDYYRTNLAREFLGISLAPSGFGFIVGRNGYAMARSFDWRKNPNGGTSPATGSFNAYAAGSGVDPLPQTAVQQ